MGWSAIASWLFEAGSLTLRLRRLCGDDFRVVLLQQSWRQPYAEESRALRLRAGQRAVVREVALQVWEKLLPAAPNLFGDYTKILLPDGPYELETPTRKV